MARPEPAHVPRNAPYDGEVRRRRPRSRGWRRRVSDAGRLRLDERRRTPPAGGRTRNSTRTGTIVHQRLSPLLVLLAAACASAPRTAPAQPAPTRAPATEAPPGPSRLEGTPVLVAARPQDVGMDPLLNARLDSIMEAAIAAGAAPGASLAVGRWGRLVHLRGYGHIDHPAYS